MNKIMRSFRSDYVEDALLVTVVIMHRPGALFGRRILSYSELAIYLAVAALGSSPTLRPLF